MALDVKLLDIPYQTLAKDADGKLDKSLPQVRGTSKFLNIMGRIVIVADIGGYKQPFYLSTGNAGKVRMPAGKWYPIFGISRDSLWINKGHSEDIAKYYDSEALRNICQRLDKSIGDKRNETNALPQPSLSSIETYDFINQSFERTTDNEMPESEIIVMSNIEQSKRILGSIYKQAAFNDAKNKMPASNSFARPKSNSNE